MSRPAPITFSPTRALSSDRTNSDIRGNRENNNASSPGNSFGKIHLSPFWENDASTYFSTIELMFQEANMTSQRSRYLALVTTLSRDASVFKSVAHLLKTTDAATPYSTLKVVILRLYSNAGGEDLETSLNDCVRGNDKVSNYLARLMSIFAFRYCEPTTLQDDILKSRVLQSVDTPTRLALYSYEQSTVDELAAHADRLLSLAKSQPATPMSKVNITSTKPHQELINEMLFTHKPPRSCFCSVFNISPIYFVSRTKRSYKSTTECSATIQVISLLVSRNLLTAIELPNAKANRVLGPHHVTSIQKTSCRTPRIRGFDRINPLFFVTDKKTGVKFLVDNGASKNFCFL